MSHAYKRQRFIERAFSRRSEIVRSVRHAAGFVETHLPELAQKLLILDVGRRWQLCKC
jgi:hypothetical protein